MTETTGRHRRLRGAAKALETLLGWTLLAAVLLNVLNVVRRYLFDDSINGADEIQIYLMVGMAFLGGAVASVRGLHLRMDALKPRFPALFRRLIDRSEALLATGLCALVAAESAQYAWRVFQLGSVSDNAHIPMWVPHSVVAIGFGLMALIGLAYMITGAPQPEADPALTGEDETDEAASMTAQVAP